MSTPTTDKSKMELGPVLADEETATPMVSSSASLMASPMASPEHRLNIPPIERPTMTTSSYNPPEHEVESDDYSDEETESPMASPEPFSDPLKLGRYYPLPPLEEWEADWEAYKLEFGKIYTAEEEPKRRQIWEKTREEIKTHNLEYGEGKHTWVMGINQFADGSRSCCFPDQLYPLAQKK